MRTAAAPDPWNPWDAVGAPEGVSAMLWQRGELEEGQLSISPVVRACLTRLLELVHPTTLFLEVLLVTAGTIALHVALVCDLPRRA